VLQVNKIWMVYCLIAMASCTPNPAPLPEYRMCGEVSTDAIDSFYAEIILYRELQNRRMYLDRAPGSPLDSFRFARLLFDEHQVMITETADPRVFSMSFYNNEGFSFLGTDAGRIAALEFVEQVASFQNTWELSGPRESCSSAQYWPG